VLPEVLPEVLPWPEVPEVLPAPEVPEVLPAPEDPDVPPEEVLPPAGVVGSSSLHATTSTAAPRANVNTAIVRLVLGIRIATSGSRPQANEDAPRRGAT